MMGQINPAGFQSPMCMFYVNVIVEINTFYFFTFLYIPQPQGLHNWSLGMDE